MDNSALLAYFAAITTIMWVPGPNALLVADAAARGGARGIAAFSLGDLAANVGQLTVAAAGLAAVIRAHGEILIALQWTGVAILTVLAVRTWVRGPSPAREPSTTRRGTPLAGLVVRGLLASAANPTAIMFFAALLPPFLDTAHPLPPQVATMAAGWIVVDGASLVAYGTFGGKLIQALMQRRPHWATHLNALSLLGAAVILTTRTLS